MAADSPWIKWWTDDFLMGVVDLAADEIGVYAVLLSLMASRGGPIPDDRRWLARRCGTGTRRFNQIVDRLTEMGKLQHRDGLIGNRRMIDELNARSSKSTQARSAAMQRWHSDQEELPLEPGLTRARTRPRAPESRKTKIISRKNEEQKVLISSNKRDKVRTSPKNAHADASPLAGARVRSSEDSEEEDHIPSHSDSGARAREGPPLRQAYDAVCQAAGFKPTDPAAIDRAMSHVDRWLHDGWDLDTVILPAIRADIAETEHPTRTLGRFTKRIRHEAARTKAKASRAPPKHSNGTPVLEPPGEDPVFVPVRKALLEQLGPQTYATWFNAITFEDCGQLQGDKHPLKLTGKAFLLDRIRADHSSTIRALAKPHGFTDLW